MKKDCFLSSGLSVASFIATAYLACTATNLSATEAPGGKAEQPVEVKKMLVLGNSITSHGPSKKLQWTGNWGMAASSEGKDYVHLLFAKLCAVQESKPELIVGDAPGTLAGHLAKLSAITAHAADLVVIQLGENDRTVTVKGFQKPYEKLIAALKEANPAARVFCCGCWGKNPMKSKLVEDACRSQGAVFVDIDAISSDPTCSAGSENRYANVGVNWHPGDKGMQGHADAIWKAIRDNPSMPPQTGSEPQAENAAAKPVPRMESSTRLRGFTTQEINLENLEDMKVRWNANSVRLMMRPNAISRWEKLPTYQDGWNKILKALPAYLDKARELDMAVILDLHEVPNENSKNYSQDRKARKSDFWNDDGNLDMMIDCWRQLVTICQGRKQIIWFDILNEPLDWNDFPDYPRKWPDWAQKTIDAIRLVDKDRRPIVIEVGPGGLCWGFKNFLLLNGEDIIYSTHNYTPHGYTHQGISSLNNTDLAQAYLKTEQPWPGVYGDNRGGLWDKARIYQELAPMIEFQKKNKVRIYISEFGVARWAPNAERYIRESLEVYEEFGWDWSFHALHENAIWSPDYEPRFLEIKLAN